MVLNLGAGTSAKGLKINLSGHQMIKGIRKKNVFF